METSEAPKASRISKGGQLTVPAAVRRRWGTARVLVYDNDAELIIRPMPEDPIGAALGSLKGSGNGLTSDQIRAITRAEDAEIEARKFGPQRDAQPR